MIVMAMMALAFTSEFHSRRTTALQEIELSKNWAIYHMTLFALSYSDM